MRTTIDQVPNLAGLATHLKNSFVFLCISVKEVLKAKNVHLDDAKLLFVCYWMISLVSNKKLSMRVLKKFKILMPFLFFFIVIGSLDISIMVY